MKGEEDDEVLEEQVDGGGHLPGGGQLDAENQGEAPEEGSGRPNENKGELTGEDNGKGPRPADD